MKRFTYIVYLFTALGMLYAANRIDERHFETAQHTLNSIHKDRVVAQDIIYQLSSAFNNRHLGYITDTAITPTDSELSQQNQVITKLFEQFSQTKLTRQEKFQFTSLKINYQKLLQYESALDNTAENPLLNIKNTFAEINDNLDELSKIQVSESSNLKSLGQKSLDSNMLMSMTETALMVVLIVVILFSIFYKGFK